MCVLVLRNQWHHMVLSFDDIIALVSAILSYMIVYDDELSSIIIIIIM